MNEYKYITLRDKAELKIEAAEWFHSKWGVPTEAYLECILLAEGIEDLLANAERYCIQ